jgi:hypothetical protein
VGRKRFTSFPRAAVEGHLEARHGRCPPEVLARCCQLNRAVLRSRLDAMRGGGQS